MTRRGADFGGVRAHGAGDARGTTLVEVIATLGAASILIGAATVVSLRADSDRRFASALAADAEGLRRAATGVERDVRAAAGVAVLPGVARLGPHEWKLDGASLLRDGEVVARRVAAFEVSRDAEGFVHAEIRVEPRTAGAARRAAVHVVARPRAEAGR